MHGHMASVLVTVMLSRQKMDLHRKNVVSEYLSPSEKYDMVNVIVTSKTTVILRNVKLSLTTRQHRDWKVHMYIRCVDSNDVRMFVSYDY